MTARLRRAVADVPRDYGGVRLALLVVALFYAGARRLEHLRYLAGDQLIARFCGVARFPTAHTISNWLKQFTQATLAPVIQRPSATMGRRQMRKSITIATVWRYISHGLRGLTGPVRLLALAAAALLLALTPWFSAQVFAQTVVATIPVVSVNPSGPVAVGVNPATNRVYVGNFGGDTVSVIDGTTNTVVATIQVPGGPHGVGVNPATKRVDQARLCGELQRQLRRGDRRDHEHRRRHHPRRLRPPWGGRQSGDQPRLCVHEQGVHEQGLKPHVKKENVTMESGPVRATGTICPKNLTPSSSASVAPMAVDSSRTSPTTSSWTPHRKSAVRAKSLLASVTGSMEEEIDHVQNIF